MSKSEKIAKTLLPLALEKLKAVKQKETDEVSAIAAVRTLRRQIERLLKLDYSYEEISQMLLGVEIRIESERLKSLHQEVKRQSRKKNKKVDNSQNSEADTNSSEKLTSDREKSSSEKLTVAKEKTDSEKLTIAGENPDSEKEKLTVARDKTSSKIAAKRKTDSNTKEAGQNTEIKAHNFQPNLIKDDEL